MADPTRETGEQWREALQKVKDILWPHHHGYDPGYELTSTACLAEQIVARLVGLEEYARGLERERDAVAEAEAVLELYGVREGTRFAIGIIQAIARAAYQSNAEHDSLRQSHDALLAAKEEVEQLLRWTDDALCGEPVSEFAQSFGVVQRAVDLRRANDFNELSSIRSAALLAALREYGQHKPGCAALLCQFAYGETNRCQQPVDSSDHDATVWPDAHAFIAGDCTCGFTDSVARVPRQEGSEDARSAVDKGSQR